MSDHHRYPFSADAALAHGGSVPHPEETADRGDNGKTGNVSGVIQRYDKKTPASDVVLAMDWIRATYDDAIEYTSVPKSLRGGLLTFSAASLMVEGVVLWIGIQLLLWRDWVSVLVGAAVSVGFSLLSTYMVMLGVRLELFSPEDIPTVFDRKHRKVHHMSRVSQPGFKGLFKPWPLITSSYDWDLMQAEHRAILSTTGTTAYRSHRLVFTVARSADDPTLVDEFQLGNGMVLDDALTDAVWEHIRRFMEEGGPALPPHQSVPDRTAPPSWWQSLGAVGPFGPKYFEWWRDSPGNMVLQHIGFAVFVPMNLIWGTGNWLSYKTALPVAWSPEIQQALGLPHATAGAKDRR